MTRWRSARSARLGRWTLGVVCIVAGALAAEASGPRPTEQLKAAIDQVIGVLEDPALKEAPRAAERRQAVRRIADEIFDFEETAQRALARHWRSLAPAQQREFVALFSEVLERAYMSRIELYGGERIQYPGERVEGDYAIVYTRFTTKNGTEVPIDYRMLRRDDRWRVYDVSVEGVSLVSNYRTQFNTLIRTSSTEELLGKMRSRVAEMRR